jgi:hypothetical protein
MAFLQPTFTNGVQTYPSFSGAPYVTGFNMTITGTSTLTLSQGSARSFTKSEAISYIAPSVIAPSTLNIDASTVGALGCYPISGILAAPTYDTAFGVYVLSSTSQLTTPGVQDLLPTAVIATGNNFLLPGYDIWRKVGTVIIEAGTNTVKPMTQSGNGDERTYLFQEAYEIVTAGAATSLTGINLSSATASYSVCNPAFVSKLLLQTQYTPTAASSILTLNTNSTAPTNGAVLVKSSGTAQMIVDFEMVPGLVSGNTEIYYKTTSGSDAVNIFLSGFTESLGIGAL